jgi:hypothetical protein
VEELSWRTLLQSQQQEFIQRLNQSLSSNLVSTKFILQSFGYPPFYQGRYHSELITIMFGKPQSEKLQKFCQQSTGEDKYNFAKYVYYNTSKIGEEAIKLYLGEMITEVNYRSSYVTSKGVSFFLSKNRDVGVQVLNKYLNRVSLYDEGIYKISDQVLAKDLVNLNCKSIDQIPNIAWSVRPSEIG